MRQLAYSVACTVDRFICRNRFTFLRYRSPVRVET